MDPLSTPHAWRVFCLVTVAALFVTQPAVAEPHAYAINSDSFSESLHDHVLRVDLATGAFEDIGPIRLGSAVAPFLDAEGLALDPGGQLWAVDAGTETFFRIDLERSERRFLEARSAISDYRQESRRDWILD